MALAPNNNLIGYGQNENNRLNRAYPSWMTGIADRGIGVANPFAAPAVPFIDIPRGGADSPGGAQGYNVQQPVFDPGMYGTPRSPQPEGGAPGDAGNGMGNTGDGSFGGFISDVSGLYGGVKDAMGSVGLGGRGMQVGGTVGSFAGPFGGLIGAGLGALVDYLGGSGNQVGSGGNGSSAASSTGGTQASNDAGFGGGYGGIDGFGGLYHGGIVTPNRLTGPDPHGPDDGYAPLDVGEGVLTAKAVNHYGKGLINRLNRMAVSKEALR